MIVQVQDKIGITRARYYILPKMKKINPVEFNLLKMNRGGREKIKNKMATVYNKR